MSYCLSKLSADESDSEDEFQEATGFEEPGPLQRVASNLIASYLPEADGKRRIWAEGGPVVLGWKFWIVVFTTMFVAWDPLHVSQMIALSREYHPCRCPNTAVECCRAVPDINESPADPANKLLTSELFSNIGVPGPETLVWDAKGRGPYAGVADGRVVRWNEDDRSWETFAYASPHWTAELCTWGRHSLQLEHVCGRPLGLKFHPISGLLYIADAYFGLAAVGPDGGQAELLCNESDGVTHKFTNDVDIHKNGLVYFTVSSTRRARRQCNIVVMEGDNTGLLVEYDPDSGNSTVLLRNMRYPNGLAIAKDGKFLLIASTLTNRLLKYWLGGCKARHLQEFAHQPGYPDNIRSTENGDFWVALHGRRTSLHVWLCRNMWAGRIVFPLSQTYKSVNNFVAENPAPMAVKYNVHGEVIDVLEDRTRTSHTQFLSNAQEREGILWLSSIYSPIISFYKKQDNSSVF